MDKESGVSPATIPVLENSGSNSEQSIGVMVGPDRHWCICSLECTIPAYNCFPTIVVTAPKWPYIIELDGHILNNPVDMFFAESGNYEELYPGINGPALTDLRNQNTTLRKVIEDTNKVTYRIVDYEYPDSIVVGYSGVYSDVEITPQQLENCNDCGDN